MIHRTPTLPGLEQHAGGTSQWYKLPFASPYTYTDGVRHVFEAGQAYWLQDHLRQIGITYGPHHRMVVIKMQVNDQNEALITLEDGDERLIHSEPIKIDATDFPAYNLTIWLIDKVFLLPVEY